MSLLIVMAFLGLVLVVPLALLAKGTALGLLVLGPMLLAGVVAEAGEAPKPSDLDGRRTPATLIDERRKAA